MAEVHCAGKSFSGDPAAEGDELEVSLYLHVWGEQGAQWFVIRNDDWEAAEEEEEGLYLRPVLLKNNPNRRLGATAAVGSNIYVIGGGYFHHPITGIFGAVAYDSVDYIDTNCPEAGWIKAAPMNHRRMECFAVPVVEKQQICVFQGRRQIERVLDAEVYDIRDGTWRDLNVWPYPEVIDLNSFAVAKNGTDLLLHSDNTKPVIWYDAEDDCYQIFKESLCGVRVHSFTISDDILYVAGFGLPGRVMALDVYDPDAELQPISGLVGREELPLRATTPLYLVELAKNKLALLWSFSNGGTLFLYCLRMVISKKKNGANRSAGGGFIFEAKSISPVAMYIIDCCYLYNILPVKTDWEKVDRRNIEYSRLQEKKKLGKGKTEKEKEVEVEKGNEKTEKEEEVEVEEKGKEKTEKDEEVDEKGMEKTEKEEDLEVEEEGKEKTEKEKKTKKKKKKKNNTNSRRRGSSRSGVSRSNGSSGSKNKKKAK